MNQLTIYKITLEIAYNKHLSLLSVLHYGKKENIPRAILSATHRLEYRGYENIHRNVEAEEPRRLDDYFINLYFM